MFRAAASRAWGVPVLAGGTTGGLWLSNNEEARRSCYMYSEFAPLVMEYRLLEARELAFPSSITQQHWDALHEKYSASTQKAILKMKGFYVKYAQTICARSDTLPEVYLSRLRVLEDQVPPMPIEQVKEVVERAYGGLALSETFSEFSSTPVGSASIGQVHKARLAKNGRLVAVKIQSPEAERLFRSDIKTAKSFCSIFAPEQVIVFDEIESQFRLEFDYREEAKNLEKMYVNMQQGGFGGQVVVPRPDFDLTRRSVLVMDYLDGLKLSDAIRAYGEEYARKLGTTYASLEREARKKYFEEGPPPPYSGPGPWQIAAYRASLAGWDLVSNAPRKVLNSFVLRPLGLKRLPLQHSVLPPNTSQIISILMKVTGHSLLLDGVFNGDLHGGNVLLLKDGRLGLIDMGQIKTLTVDERLHLSRIYRCLALGDKKELRRMAIERGYESKHLDEDVIFQMTKFALDSDGPEVIGHGTNLQKFLEEMFEKDPWSRTDNSLIMPCRLAFMLRGIGLQLNHAIRISTYWNPIARKALKDAGEEGF
jgi:predicted unusual protein kinase regulating ubiquinone biosynthesis (AarF/ABC1/UbiB family)